MPTSDRRILMEKFSSSLLLRYYAVRVIRLGKRAEEDLHHVVMRLLVDRAIRRS
jgi:hypothetical protein